MNTELLFKQQEERIAELGNSLQEIDKLESSLQLEKLSIAEEKDESGKVKFSNDPKREAELEKRSGVEVKSLKAFKIKSEMLRYQIKLYSQMIDYYSKR